MIFVTSQNWLTHIRRPTDCCDFMGCEIFLRVTGVTKRPKFEAGVTLNYQRKSSVIITMQDGTLGAYRCR